MIELRERTAADVAPLAAVLLEQRPYSGYPITLPWDGRPEQVVARDGELGAWVLTDAGSPVAHVSVLTLAADDDAPETLQWCRAHGVGPERLGVISALFVAHDHWRQGLGRRLMLHATDACRGAGLKPCLDVVPSQPGTVELYESLGWVQTGEVRPWWLPDGVPPAVTMILPG